MIKVGYNYGVTDVRQHTSKGGAPFWTAEMRDAVVRPDGKGPKYVNIKFLTFSQIGLHDGMRIRVEKINEMTTRFYNGSLYASLNIDVVEADTGGSRRLPEGEAVPTG